MADSVNTNESISIEDWNLAKSKKYIPLPTPTDNKYRRGILGCITGSKRFPGAALMSTAAALATGVGMVRYLGSRSVKGAVIQFRPAVVISSGKVDALLIGSGISLNPWNSIKIKQLIKKEIPKVIDAESIKFAKASRFPTVITPHAGELSRILQVSYKNIEAEPAKYALLAAKKYGVTVLLKGHQTIVANNKRLIQLPSAPTWLATAGTGDVLAGILGALLAINSKIITDENLIELSATASLVHAKSAMSAGTGPIDIESFINTIPEIINTFSSN